MPTSPLLAQIQSLEQTFAYRNSFREFVKGAWAIIEPNTEFVPGWHIDAICDHLEALHKGHIKKLCVAMPPRHMKSTLISVCFPTWVWLHNPSARFLCASYALSLSLRDSTRCRNLIDSEWYQERWGDVFEWLPDQNVKCVAGDTKIQTDHGELAIQAIVDRQFSVKVLSYNHRRKMLEYKPIRDYGNYKSNSCVKVLCEDGAAVECTEDHPFYVVGRGYVQARHLQVGDKVYASKRVSQRAYSAILHKLRRTDTVQSWGNKRQTKKVLRQSLSWRMDQEKSASHQDTKNVYMRSDLLRLASPCTSQILLARMLLATSSLENSRSGASSVWQGVWNNIGQHTKARQQPVHVMQKCAGPFRGASYRPQQNEQSRKQSHYALPDLSCAGNAGYEQLGGVGTTTIKSVTSILPTVVYHIEIDDNHNYFANGILTHNTRFENSARGFRIATSVEGAATGEGGSHLIVDDPHNIQEGESDMVRQATLDWFDRVFVSRLNDQRSGKMVVIGQRVHEQDLIGHLIESGDWEYLMLPAEFIPSKKTKTCIGWKDPRKKEGEVLWKTKFPKPVLTYLKKTLGIHYFSQYQQSPVRDQGNIFKSQHFLSYTDLDTHYLLHKPDGDEMVAKIHCRTVFSTDLAVSTKTEADYTVILQWAVTPDLRFILTDIVHDRMEAPETEELIWSRAVSSKRLWGVIIEDAAYQKSTIQRLRRGIRIQDNDGQRLRKGIPVIPYRPMKDKVSRAQSMVVWLASGNFFFNQNLAGFVDYKKELLGFPRIGHDDYVDATTITQALFEFGEPAMISVDEELMLAQELEAIREIEKTDPDLADFLLEDMDFEKKEWWEVYS